MGLVAMAAADAVAAGEMRLPRAPARCRPRQVAEPRLGQRDQRRHDRPCRPRPATGRRRDTGRRARRGGRRRRSPRCCPRRPASERPSGWSAKAAAWRSSKMMSRACRAPRPAPAGRPPSRARDRRPRNAAGGSGRQCSSTPSGEMLGRAARRRRLVHSRSVQALRSPPTSSIASLISRAERPPAPLNTICSKRWARPLRRAGSCREPVSAWRPTATVSTPGIGAGGDAKAVGEGGELHHGAGDLGAQGSGGNLGRPPPQREPVDQQPPPRRRRTTGRRRAGDCWALTRASAGALGDQRRRGGGAGEDDRPLLARPRRAGRRRCPSSVRRRIASAAAAQPALTEQAPARPARARPAGNERRPGRRTPSRAAAAAQASAATLRARQVTSARRKESGGSGRRVRSSSGSRSSAGIAAAAAYSASSRSFHAARCSCQTPSPIIAATATRDDEGRDDGQPPHSSRFDPALAGAVPIFEREQQRPWRGAADRW